MVSPFSCECLLARTKQRRTIFFCVVKHTTMMITNNKMSIRNQKKTQKKKISLNRLRCSLLLPHKRCRTTIFWLSDKRNNEKKMKKCTHTQLTEWMFVINDSQDSKQIAILNHRMHAYTRDKRWAPVWPVGHASCADDLFFLIFFVFCFVKRARKLKLAIKQSERRHNRCKTPWINNKIISSVEMIVQFCENMWTSFACITQLSSIMHFSRDGTIDLWNSQSVEQWIIMCIWKSVSETTDGPKQALNIY